MIRRICFPALGSEATVVAEASVLDRAREQVEVEIRAIDQSCSCFRADSELTALNESEGRPYQASDLFAEALEVALRAARQSGDPEGAAPRVAIRSGGLATSSTTVRRWRVGELDRHHLVDPRTGLPATGPWRTVSVAAASCVDANTAATAAIVMGEAAEGWLSGRRLPARLVGEDGRVLRTGGWPEDAAP